jgi:hypothetical protein
MLKGREFPAERIGRFAPFRAVLPREEISRVQRGGGYKRRLARAVPEGKQSAREDFRRH